MPTYDYRCRSCGTTYEVIHSMLEEGPTACERCGGELRRILYPTGIIFKGSGFYSTDSRSPSASTSSDGSAKAGAKPASAPASSDGSGPSSSSSTGKTAPPSGKTAPTAGET